MRFELGYGNGIQSLEVPDRNLLGVLDPNYIEIGQTEEQAVEEALRKPIGTPPLSRIIKPGEKVVIITSDITRPLPSRKILPAVLRELSGAGVLLDDITVVFALGTHRGHTIDEKRQLVGENILSAVHCVDSDSEDCIHMGTTTLGTPVSITRVVANADRRIALGNIEYHYFAGYSGGAKAIMPGVSTRNAIQNNHSRMILPEAAAGRLEDNPVRMDIEEAIGYCPLDFIVNVVLDDRKQIIHAVAGHYIEAHRAGCRFLDLLYKKNINQCADIVVASQGGSPKDLNLYQTQKALDNAKNAVKAGGIILLLGSCREGLGDDVFEEWMTGLESPGAMIERIKRDFRLGGHKAAAIALVLQRADVYLVSEMAPDFVRGIFLKPFAQAQSALDAAFKVQGKDASVLVMPHGGSTLPVLLPCH